MRQLVSVVVLVAACSGHGGAQDRARPPERDAGGASAADAPARDSDDDDSRVETAVVTAPGGLGVNVEWMTMTGTTHVASHLAITTPRGKLAFQGSDVDGRIEPLPLVEEALAAGPDRWLLLGWTSLGSGMETIHAWLVVDRIRGPEVADRIAWHTDRAHTGIAVDRASYAFAIPLPQRGALHDEDEWSLAHGSHVQTLAQLARQPAVVQDVAKLRGHYTPPLGLAPAAMHWSGRFLWFDVKGSRFVRRP